MAATLLKFTSTDVFNSNIIDIATGLVVYRVVTTTIGGRSRSRSASSFYSFASSSSSRVQVNLPSQKATSLIDMTGTTVAEITWELPDESVTNIRIGEENLAGNQEIFDPVFVQVSAEETRVPTRMEYVWRTTPEELELLNDEDDVIGMLHEDSVYADGHLSPAPKHGTGHHYLEFTSPIPAGKLTELLVTCLLMTTLRARMYWLAKFLYGRKPYKVRCEPKNPFRNLSRQAKRSIANLRGSLSRKSI